MHDQIAKEHQFLEIIYVWDTNLPQLRFSQAARRRHRRRALQLCSSVEKISRQNGLPFLPNFEDFEDADLTVFSFFKDFTRRLYG